MNFFYTPELSSASIEVSGDEFNHSIKSMRLKLGDRINLVDGNGTMVVAEIEQILKDRIRCYPVHKETDYHPLPYHLTLGIAPTKNINRYEWMIEKVTEIGVSSIAPIICQRSERRKIRFERLNKIVLAAMKQSLKAYAPQLIPLQPLQQHLDRIDPTPPQKFICHAQASNHLLDVLRKGNYLRILIGPEGDFTGNELRLATEYGYTPVHLGRQRLRTETAAVMACSMVSGFLDR